MTPTRRFPPLEALVPHRPPMLWLDEVLEHDGDRVACGLRVRDTPAYATRGEVDPAFALEWMAQACAVWIGASDAEADREPRPGLLIGVPRARFEVDAFRVGQRLRVEVERSAGSGRLASFECRVLEDGDELAQATLNFFRPDAEEAWP